MMQDKYKVQDLTTDPKVIEESASELQLGPVNVLRMILSREWDPTEIKKLVFIAKNLLERIEMNEQELEILKMSGHSEKEVSMILSKMSILEKQVEVLGIERNTLNQVIRIMASQGKIDPAAEAPEPA